MTISRLYGEANVGMVKQDYRCKSGASIEVGHSRQWLSLGKALPVIRVIAVSSLKDTFAEYA